MFESIGRIIELAGQYKLMGMALGTYLGPLLMVSSVYTMHKVLQQVGTLTQWHRDPVKEFVWASLPGIIAAMVVLGVFLFSLFLFGVGLFILLR